MLKLFKSKQRAILGIDISASCVKIIELSGDDEQRSVVDFGIEPLPANVMDGYIIRDVDAVASCIRRLISRGRFTSKYAAVAVRDSAIISKVIQINDGLADSELEEFIAMDADKYIPFPIEEVNMDFVVQGPSPKNASKLDVLIVASRSENVSSRVEAISKAGLQAKVVDVESFAIERAVSLMQNELPALGQGKVIAVMDVGYTLSSLCVMQNMKLIYSREEEFGENNLIKEIAQHYAVSYEEALQMHQEKKLPEDYYEAVFTHFIDLLTLQIKRSLQFFFSSMHIEFVDHILLAGSADLLPDLSKKVHEALNIPASIANPIHGMTLPAKLIDLHGPSLLIACGLAMRRGD